MKKKTALGFRYRGSENMKRTLKAREAFYAAQKAEQQKTEQSK